MLTLNPLWNRPYRAEHRRFRVQAADGVRIAGVHIGERAGGTLLLYVHGFLAGKEHRRVPSFVEALATHSDVMAIDLRGHGESEGGSTMGAHEVQDVEATVAYGRSLGYTRVVTVGSSMGGATVIRHAALYNSSQGVVTIGAFADVQNIGRPSADWGLRFLYRSGPLGAAWSFLTRGTRLDALHEHDAPEAIIGRIVPPLLLIHGAWDGMVHPRAAHRLYQRAREPKELLIVPRSGHDYPHLTLTTAERIHAWMQRNELT